MYIRSLKSIYHSKFAISLKWLTNNKYDIIIIRNQYIISNKTIEYKRNTDLQVIELVDNLKKELK